MSKYIVEIERVPSLDDYSVDLRPDTVNGEHTMFRISGIDHLVFDKSCMKSFEPVEALIDSTHHISYEQGYRDGGLRRTVTVYSYSGDEIASWSGKFDVTENDQETYFDIDGRRIIIRGGIIINEEEPKE